MKQFNCYFQSTGKFPNNEEISELILKYIQIEYENDKSEEMEERVLRVVQFMLFDPLDNKKNNSAIKFAFNICDKVSHSFNTKLFQ